MNVNFMNSYSLYPPSPFAQDPDKFRSCQDLGYNSRSSSCTGFTVRNSLSEYLDNLSMHPVEDDTFFPSPSSADLIRIQDLNSKSLEESDLTINQISSSGDSNGSFQYSEIEYNIENDPFIQIPKENSLVPLMGLGSTEAETAIYNASSEISNLCSSSRDLTGHVEYKRCNTHSRKNHKVIL